VRKYLTNAKSAEARTALGRIAKDAQAAYERESMTGGVVALGSTAAISHGLCPAAPPVPALIASVGNKKYQSKPGEWNVGGWSCLHFSMNDPQYYMYSYTSTGTAGGVGDVFTAIANGDLDGDGKPSTFSFGGKIQALSGETVLTLEPSIQEFSGEE
jgi:type IV pilus assembly protein PilA